MSTTNHRSDEQANQDFAHLPPMPPEPAYGRPPASQSKAFAVASLVLGIVSLFAIGIVAGPLAVIFGATRLKAGSEGRGMAIAGFILGILGTIGSVIVLALWLR